MDDLENKLRPVGIKDRETLLAMKEVEHKERGLPFDGEFYLWDFRFAELSLLLFSYSNAIESDIITKNSSRRTFPWTIPRSKNTSQPLG